MSVTKTAHRTNVHHEGAIWNVTATYGIDTERNVRGYFHVSGSATSNQKDEVGGQITELLLTAFPWLALMTQLHLANSENGEPMYAMENGWFWFNADNEEDPVSMPSNWKGMTGAERAGTYLGCDPALLENVRSKAMFIDVVISLRPSWKKLAEAAKTIYALEG